MSQNTVTLDDLRAHKDEIVKIGLEHWITNIRVCGSVLEEPIGPADDLLLLVDFLAVDGTLNLFGFMYDIEELLGHRVWAELAPGRPDVLPEVLDSIPL